MVPYRGRHAPEQRRNLGAGKRVPEDVVDEEQRVRALLVAEPLGDGEGGERNTRARTGRLVHLPVDQRGLVEHLGFLHLTVEGRALTGPLADTRETQ